MEIKKYSFSYVISYIHNPNNFTLLRRLTEELTKFTGIEVIIVEQGTSKSLDNYNLVYSKYILAYSLDDSMQSAWLNNIGAKYATTDTIVFGRYNYVVEPNAIALGVNTILSGSHDVLILNSFFINLNEQESQLGFNDLAKVDINRKSLANGITDSIFVLSKKSWSTTPFIEAFNGSEYNYVTSNVFNMLMKFGNIKEAVLYKYVSYENEPNGLGEKAQVEFNSIKNAIDNKNTDTITKYLSTITNRIGNENKYYNDGYNIE